MLTSARQTFEVVDTNVHTFATELVQLDRSLRRYGPDASDARQRLVTYARGAVDATWGAGGLSGREGTEPLLDDIGAALAAIRPSDPVRAESWREAHDTLQNVVRVRWELIEESEGTIPAAFLIVLVAWLVPIFASLGFRAPKNAVVSSSLVVAALLVSTAIYLVLDMDRPFSGVIRVSPAPLQRADEQLRKP